MKLENLYNEVYSVLHSEGWDIEHNLELLVAKSVPGLVMGEIQPITWNMKITVDDMLDMKIDGLMREYGLRYDDPVNKIVYAAVQHEKGHWSICPSSIEYIWSIYSGVSQGLYNIGFSEEQIQQYTQYIANIFEDTVVNVRYKEDMRFVDGRYLMFLSRLDAAKDGSVVFQGEIDEWMALFIDVQARLIGRNAEEREIVKNNFNKYNELSKFSVALLSAFMGRELAEKIFNGTATEHERDIAVLAVRESSNWNRASQLYAELLGSFVLNAKNLPEINSYDRYAVGGPEPENSNARQVVKNEPGERQSNGRGTKPMINMNMPFTMPPGPLFKNPNQGGKNSGMNMPLGAQAPSCQSGNGEKSQQSQGTQGTGSRNSSERKNNTSSASGDGKDGKQGQQSNGNSTAGGEGEDEKDRDAKNAGDNTNKNPKQGKESKNGGSGSEEKSKEKQENAASQSENLDKNEGAENEKQEQQRKTANGDDAKGKDGKDGASRVKVLLSQIMNMIKGNGNLNQQTGPAAGKSVENKEGDEKKDDNSNNEDKKENGQNNQNNRNEKPSFFTVKGINKKMRKEKSENDGAMRGEVLSYGIGSGGGGAGMLWIPEPERVNAIYEHDAKQTVLEFIKDDNNKKIMPSGSVLYTARRIEDERNLPYVRIDYGKTRLVPSEGGGEDMWMYEKKQLEPRTDIPENPQPTSYKDILFIVDTSGSMTWSGNPLDGSKYDLAVRSIYSIIKYLEETKKANYLNYGLILFSDNTYFSGWKDFDHIKKIKEDLIKRYEGGGTEFNPDALYYAAAKTNEKFIAILISDAWIYNDVETINAFKHIMDEGNDVAILQMSDSAYGRDLEPLSEDLAKKGATVRIVADRKDLVKLSLRITKERYVKPTKDGDKGFVAMGDYVKA